MTDLFISYSRRDQTFVRELHSRLEKVGKDVWVDWENIPLTAEWLQEIYEGIEAGDAFAYVISPDSVRSEVCSLELAHAISHNKRLVPILRRDLVEDMDKKALDPKISSHNWIYFREADDFDKAFHSLTDALDTDLDYLKTHTRLLIKAVEWNEKERDAALVLRGNDLRTATQWLDASAEKQPNPTDLQREYILSSQRAARARVRALTLYGVYFVVVVLLAGFAFLQALSAESRRKEADEQRKIAVDNANAADAARATAVYNGDQARSLALASNAQQILYRDKNPGLALALAMIANTSVAQPPTLAQGALAQAAYFPATRYILDNGTDGTSYLAVDPNEEKLLYVDNENALTVLDLNTKETLQRWPSDDADGANIRAVAFSPDGVYAAAGHESGDIRIYNTKDGSLLKEFIDDSSRADLRTITDIRFSPDGKWLVSAAFDGIGRVWDWKTGALHVSFKDHVIENVARDPSIEPGLRRVSISADSQIVATVDDGAGFLMTWDINTGALIGLYDGTYGAAWAVALFPDGKTALVGYEDLVIRWIDIETMTVLSEFKGHAAIPWDIALIADGREALSSSYDNTIIHWDLSTGKILNQFTGHTNVTYGVAPFGSSRFVSGSRDGTLRYWDLSSGAEIAHHVMSGIVRGIAMNGEAEVAAANDNGGVEVLDKTLTPQRTIPTDYDLLAMGVDNAHDLLVTAAGDNELIIVWKLSTGEKLAEKTLGFEIRNLDIHPDGDWIALVGLSIDVVLWNWKTDEVRHIPTATAAEIAGQDPIIRAVSFSLDGSQVFAGGSGGISNDVMLFDTTSGELVRKYSGHAGTIYSIALSPDGLYFASASEDDDVIIWRIDESESPRYLYGHTDDVAVVAFSPDSHYVVSGGYDNSARLWDARTSSELQRFETNAAVMSVAFEQNDSVLTGDRGGNVQHWQLRDLPTLLEWIAANRYVPELSCEQKVLYQISEETCSQ